MLRASSYIPLTARLNTIILLLLSLVDVSERWRYHAAAAAAGAGSEFTTYDVTEVQLYSNDGHRLDSTEMIVSYHYIDSWVLSRHIP